FVRLANSAVVFFFFSSRRRHTRSKRDWSSDVCSSDLSQHPRQSSQPAFTISLDVYSFPSETSARLISLNIYVFSSVLIFCPDLLPGDSVSLHKFFQIFVAADAADILEFSCFLIFKSVSLFSRTDTGTYYRNLSVPVKGQPLFFFLKEHIPFPLSDRINRA